MICEVFKQLLMVSGGLSDLQHCHCLIVIEATPLPDFHGSLPFVASEHPYFDASLAELLNAPCHVILKQVLHRCDTDQT